MLTELARQQHNIKAVRARFDEAAKRHTRSKVADNLEAKLASVEVRPPQPARKYWFYIDDAPERTCTIKEVQEAVCRHFGIDAIALRSKRRASFVVRPRQIAMYLCKQHTTRSLPEIGRMFGGYDHTTVLHNVRVIGGHKDIAGLITTDWKIAYDVAHIERLLT